MDWSNRFTLGGFTVTYSTFQMAWEVIEKTEDEDRTEISHRWFKNRKAAERWFPSKQKAENFCLSKITLK